MSQQFIELGAEPGNLGDGDTLREAFRKTQDNFGELYVSEFVNDSSLSDHADPTVPGTIAFALEAVSQRGGGSVIIGAGSYTCSERLVVGEATRLAGTGQSTIINATHAMDAIVLDSGSTGLPGRTGVESMTIQLPSTSSASAIRNKSRRAGRAYIKHITIEGGTISSWGITIDSANEFFLMGITYNGEGNGIRWINELNWGINYGDSLITGVDIGLKNPGTTGIQFRGNSNGIINNILINRAEIRSSATPAGTVGIELALTSRITLVNLDIENVETAVLNGPQSRACTFLNTYAIGCTVDYNELAPTSGVTILGGDGDFANDQRLPSRGLKLYAPSFGDYTIAQSGIRDIEKYTDPFVPRQLSLIDSGSTIFTNEGATGIVTFILPNAANTKSLEYTFSVLTPLELRIAPNNSLDSIRGYDGTVNFTPPGSYIYSLTPGTTATLRNVNNSFWIMESRIGTWEIGS